MVAERGEYYRDPRLYGVHVVWNGSATFDVYVLGYNVDRFTVYGDSMGHGCSPKQAINVIERFFDDIVSGNRPITDRYGERIY